MQSIVGLLTPNGYGKGIPFVFPKFLCIQLFLVLSMEKYDDVRNHIKNLRTDVLPQPELPSMAGAGSQQAPSILAQWHVNKSYSASSKTGKRLVGQACFESNLEKELFNVPVQALHKITVPAKVCRRAIENSSYFN